jgi:WD40 repeat protein/predicted Ser/Thr protein kinase
MGYCLNPTCSHPHNNRSQQSCQNCGQPLLLRDRYRAQSVLGQGGFGKTYRAIDEQKQTLCVIKQFLPQNQTIDTRDRFRQEAQKIATLGSHPQIPQLFDYIEQNQQQFIIQEYIEGANLAQTLEQIGPFREPQIRKLLEELLPVLQFLHENQVIHRDVKPDNIIQRSQGVFVLVDFGAAKSTSQTTLGKTGTMIGSANYAAPEQTFGKAIFASDIYSLGVTCLHLLTGVSPFQLYDMSEGTWAWRDYLKQPVSDRMGRVLDQMVESATKQRYASAEEALQALKTGSISSSGLARSGPTSPLEPPTSSSSTKSTPSKRSVQVSFLRTMEGHSKAVHGIAISTDANFVASGGNDSMVRLWERESGRLLRTVTKEREFTGSFDAIAFAPDAQTFAAAGWEGNIHLWQTASGWKARSLSGHEGLITGLAFSPDGKWLYSSGYDGTIRIWEIGLNTRLFLAQIINCKSFQTIPDAHSGWVCGISLSADGKYLASVGWDGTVKLWNVAKGVLSRTLTGHQGSTQAVAFSPTGKMLASSGSKDKTVRLWSAINGEELLTLKRTSGSTQSIAFSPDGNFLATAQTDAKIKLWRVNGELIDTLLGHHDIINSVAFSADGKTLVSGSADRTIKIWSLRLR